MNRELGVCLALAGFLIACGAAEPTQSLIENEVRDPALSEPQSWRSDGVDQVLGLTITEDDHFVVAGRFGGEGAESNGFVSKVSPQGDMMWTNILGSDGLDLFVDVGSHPSGLVIAGGVSTGDFLGNPNALFSDGALVALNADGEVQWSLLLGIGPINQIEVVNDGVLVTGSGLRPGRTDTDAFVVKVSLNGAIVWTRWIESAGSDSATGLAHVDGLIWVVGFTDGVFGDAAATGNLSGWVAHATEDGTLIETSQVDLGGNESLTRVCALDSGVLVLGGYTDSRADIDSLLMVWSPEHREVARWVSEWEGNDAVYGLLCRNDGSIVITGRLDGVEASDAFGASLDDNLTMEASWTSQVPGRDEWVDVVEWGSQLCYGGYQLSDQALSQEEFDAVLACE